MSQSHIPIVSQIGEAGAAVGGFVGRALGLNSNSAPKPTASPAIAGPDDAATAAAMSKAERDANAQIGRGEAANMLSGGHGSANDGWSDDPNTYSRSVLLGS